VFSLMLIWLCYLRNKSSAILVMILANRTHNGWLYGKIKCLWVLSQSGIATYKDIKIKIKPMAWVVSRFCQLRQFRVIGLVNIGLLTCDATMFKFYISFLVVRKVNESNMDINITKNRAWMSYHFSQLRQWRNGSSSMSKKPTGIHMHM
jgi:hypothetical protein